MAGLAQFVVLFAGPLGILGLTAFLVVRWLRQSRRREPTAPQLAVIPGKAVDADEATPLAEGNPEERPPLRLVAQDRRSGRRDLPRRD